MTGCNAKSQKIHAEKDRKQEKSRSGNSTVFQNLTKIVVHLFGFFFNLVDPEVLFCMGQLLTKKGGQDSN